METLYRLALRSVITSRFHVRILSEMSSLLPECHANIRPLLLGGKNTLAPFAAAVSPECQAKEVTRKLQCRVRQVWMPQSHKLFFIGYSGGLFPTSCLAK